MKRRKITIFLLTFLLALALLPVSGLSAYADGLAGDDDSAASTFNSIVNMGKPQSYTAGGVDPYGYGEGVPFTLSAAHEVVAYGYRASGSAWTGFDSYDNLTYEGANILTSGKINKHYNFEESGSVTKKALNAPQTVSFDPKGTGRKDHLAVLGVNFTDSSASLCLCVYDNNGKGTPLGQLEIGTVNWMKNGGEYFTYYSVKNYYSITAGDYDGDHKDTLVVYGCLDGWGLGLFEIRLQDTNGGISLVKKNVSAERALLMPVYDGDTEFGVTLQSYVDDFVTSTGSGNVYKKLCGEVATGDLNGDHVDDLAVLTYHAGAFLGCYPSYSYNGSGNVSLDEEHTWDPSSPYVSYQLGAKGSASSVISQKTAGTWVHKYMEGSEYDFDCIAAPGLAVGEITGDQKSEIVVGGYLKNLKSGNMKNGKQKIDSSDTTVLVSYKATDEGLVEGPSNWNMVTAELMKLGFYESDHDIFNKSAVVTAAIDGRGMPGYVFVNGMLAKATSQSFETTMYSLGMEPSHIGSSGSSSNSISGYYDVRSDKNKYTNIWIDSVAVGNFDGGIDGKEEILYSIGVKTKSEDKFCFDMGEIYLGSGGLLGSLVHQLDYPAANTPGKLTKAGQELCLTLCSVDNDNDGIIAKYAGKGWVYSDPEIVALLQAAPYFQELDDAGALYTDGETAYSVTESYSLEKTTSNAVSFGVGGTHSLAGTLGGYEVKAGYALDWSEEFTKAQTTSQTITWHAFENSVVISRTPVIIYYYRYMDSEGDYPENDNIYEIAIPQAPVTETLSVERYNAFAKYYNKYYEELADQMGLNKNTVLPVLPIIQESHLLKEGDPFSYWSMSDSDCTLLTNTALHAGPGRSSVTVEHSSESSYTSSESIAHGFNFELTITFGLDIPGFVSSTVGGYTSLNYMHGHAVATTQMSGKGITGTVSNYDSAKAKAAGISNYENCGFYYKMAKWNYSVKDKQGGGTYPVYGYALSDIVAPIMSLQTAEVTLDKTEYYYTGDEIRPEPTVKVGGKILTKDEDYTVSYKNNILKGTAHVIITGKGSWNGSADKTFPILSRFAGHSLSLNGDIGVNFYLHLTAEEAASAYVYFTWNDKELENVEVVLDANGSGLYRASCPVAVAEMTDLVSANLFLDNKYLEVDIFSVAAYANVILKDNDFITDYIGQNGWYKYNKLYNLVATMLDVGGEAQKHFEHNLDYLANEQLVPYETGDEFLIYIDRYEVTGESIFAYLEDTLRENGSVTVPKEFREKYGLAYVGSTLVFLSKTSLRHYFKVVDEEKFALVKDFGIGWKEGDTNLGTVQPVEKDSLVYFEKRDIPAKKLQTMLTLSVGGSTFTYSPLHYLMACLNSDTISEDMKELARAAFRYARAADEFFA